MSDESEVAARLRKERDEAKASDPDWAEAFQGIAELQEELDRRPLCTHGTPTLGCTVCDFAFDEDKI